MDPEIIKLASEIPVLVLLVWLNVQKEKIIQSLLERIEENDRAWRDCLIDCYKCGGGVHDLED